MLAVRNRVTDGVGTFTPQDSRPCWPLPRQCHNISTIARTHDSSVSASSSLTLSPSVLSFLTRLFSLQGGASPLWPARCSVYASPLLFTYATVSIPFASLSARGATLNTGGWLALMSDHPDPSPTGTCTRQEAPSFAWRTKDKTCILIGQSILYCALQAIG